MRLGDAGGDLRDTVLSNGCTGGVNRRMWFASRAFIESPKCDPVTAITRISMRLQGRDQE